MKPSNNAVVRTLIGNIVVHEMTLLFVAFLCGLRAYRRHDLKLSIWLGLLRVEAVLG